MGAIGMSDLLTPARIIPRLGAPTKDVLLRELASRLAAGTGLSRDVLLEAAAGAAALPPFMPRGGVSLLHALVDGLAEPRAILARLKQPLDLGGGCASDVVVLLASPAERTGDHLRALACLARRLRRPDVLAHLRAAKCRELMYVALTSDEWCGHEGDSPSSRRARRGNGN